MWGLSRTAAPLVQAASGHIAAAAACSGASSSAAAGAGQQAQQRRRGSHLALSNINPGVVGGPGNRSSVSGGVATVFGATGFVGHYVVNALAKAGTQVVCPYRSVEERAMPLKQMGDLGQVVLLKGWHLADDAATAAALSRSNIVINLIGSSLETRNFSFDDVHAAWPERLAQLVKAHAPHAERFIHFSDMGAAADHPSRRMRSKDAGDEAVRYHLPHATIFKPSPIMGDEDDFLNNLLFQVKLNANVWMVDDGAFTSQPSHVTDVARAVAASLETRDAAGQTYYLGGPEDLSLRDIVELIQACLHDIDDNTLYVPAALAKALYAPGDAIRRKLPPLPGRNYMNTVDWVDEISRNKLTPEGALTYADLGILPMKVTEGLPIEAVRYQRVGGWSGGLVGAAHRLPTSVKRYWGMQASQ